MSYLDHQSEQEGLTNRITAIERDAIAWAAGYHLATRKIGVVYMQNSGLGNTINPITSLADPYQIPILLMIGWRGEPGKKDEPQHITMGPMTIPLLDTLEIKYSILPDDIGGAQKILAQASEYVKQTRKIYALIIRKGTFVQYQAENTDNETLEMSREDVIKTIVGQMNSDEIICSTTGKASRELFEYREEKGQGHQNDFLMVGSMGCAAAFGAEIALQKPDKQVFVFDGDGAAIMGMGSLSTIGYYQPKNFLHLVMDNESYESTGSQPTTSSSVDFERLALANNYRGVRRVETKTDLIEAFKEMREKDGPQMLIAKVSKLSRKELGRPTTTPIENKEAIMRYLSK